jgi:hypothetical protein
MRMGKRASLLLTVVATLLTSAAGVAVAASTVNCATTSLCTGTSGDDTIYGNQWNNWLEGRGGSDVILGKQGKDQLYGGKKDPNTGASDLSSTADTSSDAIKGGQGDDKIYGGKGNDTLRDLSGYNATKQNGVEDADSIYGEDGDDLLGAADGDTKDTVDGGSGTNDSCEVDAKDSTKAQEDGNNGNNDKYTNCETVKVVVGATADNAAEA